MFREPPKLRDRFTVGIERCAEGRAVKYFGGDALAEYDKARAMESAFAGTPFHVPRALRCDEDSGRVEFEFLEGAVLLQEILEQAYDTRRFRRVLKLNDAAARLLGTLHQRLEVPNARPWRPPAFLAQRAERLGYHLAGTDDVFLHCDYSPVNLLVDRDDRMAVIDASPNSYFTDYACLKGHRFVDVAGYTCKLTWPYRLRSHSPAWRKLAATMRRRFVSVYEQTSGRAVDDRLLRIFESAIVRSFVEWKTTSRLLRSAALGLERIGLHRRP